MVDPALDAGVELGEADRAGMMGGKPRPQLGQMLLRPVLEAGDARRAALAPRRL